jgi:hypothetical protein
MMKDMREGRHSPESRIETRATAAPEERIKVLYIGGNGRSGSTLLDGILGQVPGMFAVGEVRQIWDEGIVENRLCGCGSRVHDCGIWREVIRELRADPALDGLRMAQLREQLAQTKRLIPILANPRRYHRRAVPGLEEFLAATARLYKAVAQVTRSSVIVDSSKWPTYSFLLGLIREIDLYVLHLVRDPRACAFSWTRGKDTEPGKPIGIQSAAYTTAYWIVWNPALRHLWRRRADRYELVRYEDLIRHPRPTLERITDFVGLSGAALPFIDDRTVSVTTTHAIAGNPAKFVQGPVRLTLDDEWRRHMRSSRRCLVTTLTWPLLWRYGYLKHDA